MFFCFISIWNLCIFNFVYNAKRKREGCMQIDFKTSHCIIRDFFMSFYSRKFIPLALLSHTYKELIFKNNYFSYHSLHTFLTGSVQRFYLNSVWSSQPAKAFWNLRDEFPRKRFYVELYEREKMCMRERERCKEESQRTKMKMWARIVMF